MESNTLKISVVIPHRESESIDETLRQVLSQNYPQDKIEIFSVTGNQPSIQRNACIKESKGDIIYFLDNDSEAVSSNIAEAVKLFEKNSKIGVVGGPNIPKEGDTPLQKDFSTILRSPFGTGPVNSRYKTDGEVRECDDKSLILCNLFVRKSVLDEVGLFNESLYPNEENELMERIVKKGYKLFYHPRIVVKRSPRENLKAFIKMLLGYGRGRFEQSVSSFSFKNIVFFIPPLFVLYLVLLIPSIIVGIQIANKYALLLCLPLFPYILLIITAFVSSVPKRGFRISLPFLFITTHFFYGVGFFFGAFKKLFSKKEKQISFEVTKAKNF